MTTWLRFLFSFRGTVAPRPFALAAVLLVMVKYGIDSAVAASFGVPWHITAYVMPAATINSQSMMSLHPALFALLWTIAIPFFWAGVSLTLRRLRDAGLPSLLLVLFFIPVANFLLFLTLCLSPTQREQEDDSNEKETFIYLPNAPVLGFVLAVGLGIVLVWFSARFLAQYAWGLFLGVPFAIGFVTSWCLNARKVRSLAQTSAVASTAVLIVGACLLQFRLEGLICLAMAVPLAIPLAIGGAMVARACLLRSAEKLVPHTGGLSLCVAILPMLMLVEHGAAPQPAIRPVTTSIVVNAPVDRVWDNVVAFPPLPAPNEWVFRTGIAYPTGATITGTGVGAVRRCRFSTGDFVEPITVWDRNHLLAFDVAEQPPAMAEITLGAGPLHTPHIERNYLHSHHGQFRLVALSANQTLLEGTTWYQDYFWPQAYWRPWSDAIIHRIHMRVLQHVKQQAELATTP